MLTRIAAPNAVVLLGLCCFNPARAQQSVSALQQAPFTAAIEDTPEAAPARIVQPINESQLVRLTGNTHPMARAEFDRGPVDLAMPMERLILVLERSPEQEAKLTQFMARQLDPASPDYHRWLAPAEFGALYGPAEQDIQAVSAWLESHSFTVDRVAAGRMFIEFSGSAGMVEQAFHTSIHHFDVNGEQHVANNTDPSIPKALRPVVAGVFSLNDFHARSMQIGRGSARRDPDTGKWTPLEDGSAEPLFGVTNGGATLELVSPWDFATIYNVTPLWNDNIDGAGVTLAIAGRSNISLDDVKNFRAAFGLPARAPTVVLNGVDPGVSNLNDRSENTLDVEWAGAVAKGANIKLVTTKSTATTDGAYASALYIVDKNLAPVMSSSYGQCELALGTTQNAAYNTMWQQGAAEGISIFVASGDSGAAGCDIAWTPSSAVGSGLHVSGIASTPYNVAVGGTDLDWANLTAKYWSATNATNGSSALGYIPEVAWNGSCASDDVDKFLGLFKLGYDEAGSCNYLWTNKTNLGYVTVQGSGGGVSACTTPTKTGTCAGGYSKPSWQTGTGVPNDSLRDLPDLALYASYMTLNSAYVFCDSGSTPCTFTDPAKTVAQTTGGTSAASPAMAGIMALVLQKAGGAPQGLPNPVFYKLAAKEDLTSCNALAAAAGNSCTFYDITGDGNAQPCLHNSGNCKFDKAGDTIGILTGYKATRGYDQATGLGSVNANNLVNAWSSVAPAPAVSLSATSLTFASTKVGQSAPSQTVTVKNTGAGWLNFPTNSVILVGGDYASFPTTDTCTAPVAPGGTCSATVTFKPQSGGALSTTLQFGDNAAGSPQNVTLKGTGVTLPPAVNLSTKILTFPSTQVGSSAPSQVVTVENTGAGPLTIPSGGITMVSGSTTSFTAKTTCTAPVAPGLSCTITVTFIPQVAGNLETNLTIADNAPDSPQSVLLKGTATPAPAIVVILSQTKMTFPTVTLGSQSQFQAMYAQNTSPYPVKVGPISLGGTNPASFVELNNCPATLAGGASCWLYVAFKPVAAGNLTASISFADSADAGTQTVALSGTGQAAPGVTLNPKNLTFPTTARGTMAPIQSVTLTNTGSWVLTMKDIEIGGPGASSFLQINNCTLFVPPGGSCTLQVAFLPAVAGTLNATLTVTDSGTGSPQTVALTGTGK